MYRAWSLGLTTVAFAEDEDLPQDLARLVLCKLYSIETPYE